MYRVVFHPLAADDLAAKLPAKIAKCFIQKTEQRLSVHPETDGRTIKRLRHLVVNVFFEYKVRHDWRAIFYLDIIHKEIRVLGFVPKNIGSRLFDRRLDQLFLERYGNLF